MMPKAPARPEEIFEDFSSDYREAFGSDLLSIILYGSGARGEYIPKKSDLNFMIVLSENGMNRLSKAIPLVSKWHKKRVNTPLFLTPASITSSLDTFPIEFFNIKAAHKVVCGENFLKNLAFDKNYMRLQCEHEVKGKLMQLKKHFLETAGNWRKTEALISASLPTFFSLFQAIMFLKDKEPIAERHTLVKTVAQETGLNQDLFLELLTIREGRKKLTSSQVIPLMEKYIGEIQKLSTFLDQLKIR
jgi:predicted nucleotidyltransferase